MDPNAALTEVLTTAQNLQRAIDNERVLDENEVAILVEHVLALDEWLRKGGFLPVRWKTRSAEPVER